MKFKYNFSKALILIFIFGSSFTTIYALESDREKPIEIRAEESKTKLQEKYNELVGNIDIYQGSLKIHGNKVIIKKNSADKTIVTVNGSQATFQQLLDSKNELGKNQIFKGKANTINYDSETGIVILTGNVNIEIDKNKMLGNKVIYNTITEEYKITSSPKNRVSIVIYPKKSSKK